MNKLDNYREKLNNIDAKLLVLLNERFETVIEIGQYKKENNMAVYDPEREKKVIERLSEKEKYNGMVEAIWHPIMDFAKTLE